MKPQHAQVDSGGESIEKRNIVLSVDIMHFTGICFLVTVSRDFKFITAGALTDWKKVTVLKSIKHVINLYKGKGHEVEKVVFTEWNSPVHTILADNEFESLREDIEECGVQVNLTKKDEHTMLKSIKYVINLYKGKGHEVEKVDFTEWNSPVHKILADNEFESLQEDIEECGVQVNVTTKDEHVPEVE